MVNKCRLMPAILIFLVSVFLIRDVAFALSNIPVPTSTVQTKQEKRSLGNLGLDFYYYVSTLTLDEVKGFYRKKLPDLGWEEQNLAKQLEQASVPSSVGPALLTKLEYNLTFTKKNEQLIITFLPTAYQKDKNTRFTICHGNATEKTIDATSFKDGIPHLLAKPKKDVTPTYPGANLIMLSEKEDSFQAGYFSKDEIEPVISFYKNNMVSYGWSLREEMPIETKKSGDYIGQNLQRFCPTCAQNAANMPNFELRLGRLTFTNEEGDLCNISVSNAKSTQKENPSFMMSTILVNYYEAKKK